MSAMLSARTLLLVLVVGPAAALVALQAAMIVSSRVNDARTALGAGTMGAQIAAHLANAGVPVLLLDLTPELAREGLARARKLKPDPFFTADADV